MNSFNANYSANWIREEKAQQKPVGGFVSMLITVQIG